MTPVIGRGAPPWLQPSLATPERRAAGRERRRILPMGSVCAWRGGVPRSWREVPSAISADNVTGLQGQLLGTAHLRCVEGAHGEGPFLDVGDLTHAVWGPWEWDVRFTALQLAAAAPHHGAAIKDVRRFARAYVAGVRSRAGWSAAPASLIAAREAYRDLIGGEHGDVIRTGLPVLSAKNAMRQWASPDRQRDGGESVESSEEAPAGDGAPSLAEVRRWFAEYRENLPEPAAVLLADCVITGVQPADGHGSADFGEEPAERDLIVAGSVHGGRILWRLQQARPSLWDSQEPGADAQRILLASGLLRAVPDPLSGWSSDPRRLGSWLWSTSLAARSRRSGRSERSRRVLQACPAWWRKRWAHTLGAALARAHACTIDCAALSGYLGGGDEFGWALAMSSAEAADGLRAR